MVKRKDFNATLKQLTDSFVSVPDQIAGIEHCSLVRKRVDLKTTPPWFTVRCPACCGLHARTTDNHCWQLHKLATAF